MAESVKQTPPKHSQTPQSMKGDVQYPNYFTFQDRTGNVPWFINNTKGNEFIMVQHRTGSYWEFTSTGSFNLVASQNREDITFGKHVSYVTGAYDVTVDGDSSTKTKGTRRDTTNGNSEQTVKGDAAVSAKSFNVAASEGIDFGGQSFTSKTKSVLIQATDGPVTMAAAGNAGILSKEGSVALSAEAGAIGIQAAQKISMKGKEVHAGDGEGSVVITEGFVLINCSGSFVPPVAAWVNRPKGAETIEA